MNRPFWSFRTSAPPDNCDTIEPLLSVYTDDLALPADVQRIDAHLPGCEGCRVALSWMQATRAALASRPVAVPPPGLHSRIALAIALSSRPVAVPPPDLHSRIARAIAASSPAPVLRRPARVFTLRTAYAAAASLTALGIALSYPLWHTPGEVAVTHPAKPSVLAAAPPVKTTVTPKTTRSLVASSAVNPAAAKHMIIARKTVPAAVTPLKHVATNTLPVKLPAASQEVIVPVHHALPAPRVASREIAPTEKHSIEKHLSLPVKAITPKLPEGPKVAKVIKEPTRVPLDIRTPKVTLDLPPARVASIHEAMSLRSDNILKSVVAHTEDMRKESLAAISIPAQRSYHEATSVIQEVGNTDHTAFVSAVHGNQ